MVRCKSIADTQVLVDAINNQRTEPLLSMTSTAAFKRVGGMSIWMAALGQFIAIVIAFGAVFGGMNTMYAAVATRSREIGILRAIGFRSGAVLLSMWTESVLVGIMGGVAGILLAFVVAKVPLNMPFLLEGSVSLHTGDLVAGLVLALVVGGLGGLLPSLQASRLKVVDVLR
jgi:putative ABC transport system permease protein